MSPVRLGRSLALPTRAASPSRCHYYPCCKLPNSIRADVQGTHTAPLWQSCMAVVQSSLFNPMTRLVDYDKPRLKWISMKSHTEYLTFNLPARMAFENITPTIEAIVQKSGIQEGFVLCNQPQRSVLLTRIPE